MREAMEDPLEFEKVDVLLDELTASIRAKEYAPVLRPAVDRGTGSPGRHFVKLQPPPYAPSGTPAILLPPDPAPQLLPQPPVTALATTAKSSLRLLSARSLLRRPLNISGLIHEFKPLLFPVLTKPNAPNFLPGENGNIFVHRAAKSVPASWAAKGHFCTMWVYGRGHQGLRWAGRQTHSRCLESTACCP